MSPFAKQKALALASPVFDPGTQITRRFFWFPERLISAGLTCSALNDPIESDAREGP